MSETQDMLRKLLNYKNDELLYLAMKQVNSQRVVAIAILLQKGISPDVIGERVKNDYEFPEWGEVVRRVATHMSKMGANDE